MSANLGDALGFISRQLSEFVLAYLMAIIWGKTTAFSVAQIILAIKLNVFALPLMNTPVLDLPLWITYVVVVLWILKLVQLTPYSVGEIIEQVEGDIQRIRHWVQSRQFSSSQTRYSDSSEVVSDD